MLQVLALQNRLAPFESKAPLFEILNVDYDEQGNDADLCLLEKCFCGFYRCVNAGESLSKSVKPMPSGHLVPK